MKRLPKLTVYKADDGWRWNYRAPNGRVMADSGEAYRERGKCVRAAAQVLGMDAWDLRLLAADLPGTYSNAPMAVRIEGRP